VSFAYERGWRRSFSWAGFPGEEKEFEMAMAFLQGAYGEARRPSPLVLTFLIMMTHKGLQYLDALSLP
jgi:hypothetical protein